MVVRRWLNLMCRVVAASFLGVFASPAGQAQDVTVTFGYGWAADAQAQRAEIARMLVEEFNAANPGVTVEIVAISSNLDQIRTMVAGGAPPDIYMTWAPYVIRQFGPQLLADLSGELTHLNRQAQVLADLPDALQNAFVVDGKILGLPISTEPNGIYYYNHELFDRAGIPKPAPGWNWDDLTQSARRLTIRNADRTEQWGIVPLTHYFAVDAMIQRGAKEYSDDGRVFLPNLEETIAAWRWSLDLVENGLMMYPRNATGTSGLSLFTSGQAGFLHDGSYRLPALTSTSFEVGIAPPITGTIMAVTGTTQTFMAFKSGDAAREQAAARFVVWVTEPPQAARWDIAWGNLPNRRSTALERYYIDNLSPQMAALTEYLSYVHMTDWHPISADMTGLFDRYFNAVMAGTMPVESAIDQLRHEGQAQVDQYWARVE